jgi:hypothetical protein
VLRTPLPTEEDARKLAEQLGRYKVIPLTKVDSTSDLRHAIGVDALHMGWSDGLSTEQQQAAAVLKDLLRDYLDIWNDLTATNQVEALSTIQQELDRLAALDLVTTFGVETLRLKSDTVPDPFSMDTLYIFVSKGSEPKLFAMREKGQPFRFGDGVGVGEAGSVGLLRT